MGKWEMINNWTGTEEWELYKRVEYINYLKDMRDAGRNPMAYEEFNEDVEIILDQWCN